MRNFLFKMGLFLPLVAFTALGFAAEYQVDTEHSTVAFSIRHLVGRVSGNFPLFEGKFSFDAAKLGGSKGEFKIQTASINTNNAKRDTHLKSPDFFDVTKYPEITFVSKTVTPRGKTHFQLEGEMTMHGVTRMVSFDVEYLGTQKDPWGGTRSGFVATTHLNRKDFGIVWNQTLDKGSLMIGDEVAVTLNIEAVQQPTK